MQTFEPRAFDDLSGGMVSYADLDVLPENTSPQVINMHFDLKGDVVQRNGTTKLGATVNNGNACQGTAQFITSNQNTNRLVAAFNGTNYSFDGTTWTAIGGGMTLAAVRYTSFLNLLFRVGGGSATQSWNGAGNFANTNVSNAPNGKYILPYKQRLYIAGDPNFPNRLWFSTIADSNGNITWDTSATSTQYIDFTAGQANDIITGLGKISNLLLIFLNNAMYRYNATSTDPEIVVDIGCSSQESIAQGQTSLFFFNPTGIYMTTGGYPQEISRPIYDWIQGISPSNYSSVAGFCDQDHYYCFVGTVTFTGTSKIRRLASFSNVMLVYTISSQTWTVYSLGNSYKAFTKYTDITGALTYVGGDSVGNVQTMWSGTTDNGTPIAWEYQTREYNYGSNALLKSFVDVSFTVVNGFGAQIAATEDNKPFRTLGEVTHLTSFFTSLNIKGYQVSFKMFGSNSGTPVIFDGYDFIKVQSHGYVRT